jgi:serine/threonine-protein kinase RsbW
VQIKLSLSLPSDELSVPVARRVCVQAMRALGVTESCAHDLEVALAEACSNVLKHAQRGDEYEVSAGIDHERCVLEVVDTGHGFDSEDLGRADADAEAERGRGIQLMRALVDAVRFESRHESGTIVHMEKALEWHDAAPVKRLTEGRPRTEHGPWDDVDLVDEVRSGR